MASIIVEFAERNGKCEACGTETMLVTTHNWNIDSEQLPDDGGYECCEPEGETSGHYCPKCNSLTAVFVHTPRVDHLRSQASARCRRR